MNGLGFRAGLRHYLVLLTALVFGLASTPAVWGQGGIAVDTNQVYRVGKSARNSRFQKNTDSWRSNLENRGFVALKRLAAQIQSHLQAGTEIPLNLLYLDGLVDLEAVIFDRTEQEIYLVGRREALQTQSFKDARNQPAPFPAGVKSGRPALRWDDLVTIYRTFQKPQNGTTLGCSLDLDPDLHARMQAAGSAPGATVQMVLEAAGNEQSVRFFGLQPNTPTALACLEADVLLKRLALGLERSPTRAVRSQYDLMSATDAGVTRWWFRMHPKARLISFDDKVSFALPQQLLEVVAADSLTHDTGTAPACAQKFAEAMTDHLPLMFEALPSLAHLENIMNLAVALRTIQREGLDQQFQLDLNWTAIYPLPEVQTSEKMELLSRVKQFANSVTVICGGVLFTPDEILGRSREEYSAERSATWLEIPAGDGIARAREPIGEHDLSDLLKKRKR